MSTEDCEAFTVDPYDATVGSSSWILKGNSLFVELLSQVQDGKASVVFQPGNNVEINLCGTKFIFNQSPTEFTVGDLIESACLSRLPYGFLCRKCSKRQTLAALSF